jgi:hypothetical protein
MKQKISAIFAKHNHRSKHPKSVFDLENDTFGPYNKGVVKVVIGRDVSLSITPYCPNFSRFLWFPLP